MHSTFSENIEGGQVKEDLSRNEMYSSNMQGPFLKIGNVFYGASMHNLEPDDTVAQEVGQEIDQGHSSMSLTKPTGSAHQIMDINVPVQTGAGKTVNKAKTSTKKSKQNSKKPTSNKKKTTKKPSKGSKAKKGNKSKKSTSKKSTKGTKGKSTNKKTSKKKSTSSKQKGSKKK